MRRCRSRLPRCVEQSREGKMTAVSHLAPEFGIDVKRISEISGMAEATILTSYADMYPYAAKMLPEAYVERIPELEAPKMDKGDAAALEAGLAGLIGGDAEDGGGGALSLPPP